MARSLGSPEDVFRPFPGFKTIRLLPRETKTGKKIFFCFVDFDTVEQASVAMHTLQGYRYHWKDKRGLKVSYATPTCDLRRRRPFDADSLDSRDLPRLSRHALAS